MTGSLYIRDARPDEQETVREITLAAYAEYERIMTPAAWEGLRGAVLDGLAATQSVQRIVAERDGQIVGSVMLFMPDTDSYAGRVARSAVPELRLLSVPPAVRGQGIGQALMDECVWRARSMGAEALGLHTSKSMQVAIHMYERMGFIRRPEDDFQPPGAELVTAYRLPL